jgi:hypothetical protein
MWQINNYWHPEVSDSCAYDSKCNARAAKKISSGGSNWTPWATYNGGAYKSHLSSAREACGEMRDADTTDVGGEPSSCKKKLMQLCGHCGTDKHCWVSCAKSHEGELLAAGCKKPSLNTVNGEEVFKMVALGPGGTKPPSDSVGGEPSSCKKELMQLCGHCGTDKHCWVSCAKSHEGELLAAGCKKPSSNTYNAEEVFKMVALGPGGTKPHSSTLWWNDLVGGEPSSCKKELMQLCGHCGTGKNCWVSCAESHQGQLLAAGCTKPSSSSFEAQQVGGEPASCTKKLKKLCGHCGADKSCWVSCAKQHKSDLLKAGCKKPNAVNTLDIQEAGSAADVTKDLFLFHIYESHCAVLAIPNGRHSNFWQDYGYKYDHFKPGRCPHIYNYINKRISAVEGVKRVDMIVRGIHKPLRSFRDIMAMDGSENACPADECSCCPKKSDGSPSCPCLCGGGWCKRCCQ